MRKIFGIFVLISLIALSIPSVVLADGNQPIHRYPHQACWTANMIINVAMVYRGDIYIDKDSDQAALLVKLENLVSDQIELPEKYLYVFNEDDFVIIDFVPTGKSGCWEVPSYILDMYYLPINVFQKSGCPFSLDDALTSFYANASKQLSTGDRLRDQSHITFGPGGIDLTNYGAEETTYVYDDGCLSPLE